MNVPAVAGRSAGGVILTLLVVFLIAPVLVVVLM